MSNTSIVPSAVARLEFFVLDATYIPVPSLTHAAVSAAAYIMRTAGVDAAPVAQAVTSSVASTVAVVAGQFVTIDSSRGHYAIDCPAGAALSTADTVRLSVTMVDGTRIVRVVRHEIDVAVSTRNSTVPPTAAANATAVRSELATELARIDLPISTRNDVTPPSVSEIKTGVTELSLASQASIDAMAAVITASAGDQTPLVIRSTSDTNAINFTWPVASAVITGTVSLDGDATPAAITGSISFVRTDSGKHFYSLAYNAADRTAAEGSAIYELTDGTYTLDMNLRIERASATSADVNAQVLDAITVDLFPELAAPPAANSSLKDKLTWLFMWARNKATESTTQRKLYADDGTTVVSTEAMSDTAGTFTKGEQV